MDFLAEEHEKPRREVVVSAYWIDVYPVTNDRFRDWADVHPEVREPGHLIRGGYRDGVLWLDA